MFRNHLRKLVCGIVSAGSVALWANAQSPAMNPVPSDPQVSPQAAYEQATRPLEITRRAPQNWSEIELAALKVARENAKLACAARNADQFIGDDLIGLARLCAFAMEWNSVHQAASKYIAASQGAALATPDTDQGHLAMAFDYQVQASLSLKNLDDAIAATQAMLRSVPYDEFASEASTSTIEAIRFSRTEQALALLKQRQPMILETIKAPEPPQNAAAGAEAGPTNLRLGLPLHALYTDATALPALQQFMNDPKAAEASFADLNSALPRSVPADEAVYIEPRRRQYLLLGAHLPVLAPMGFLLTPGATSPPDLNSWFAKASVFLLFPDWCTQCVTMGFNFASKGRELVAAHDVRPFALVAQASAPAKRTELETRDVPLSLKAAQAAKAQSQALHVDQQLSVQSTPDGLLEGTATVVVPNQTLNAFAATDFPLLIFTDHTGIIRWTERGSDDALAPGGDIEQVLQHILATWPAQE